MEEVLVLFQCFFPTSQAVSTRGLLPRKRHTWLKWLTGWEQPLHMGHGQVSWIRFLDPWCIIHPYVYIYIEHYITPIISYMSGDIPYS